MPSHVPIAHLLNLLLRHESFGYLQPLPGLFFQFHEVGGMAILYKSLYKRTLPDLATGQREKYICFETLLCTGDMQEPVVYGNFNPFFP
jgi:hypothetical protein